MSCFCFVIFFNKTRKGRRKNCASKPHRRALMFSLPSRLFIFNRLICYRLPIKQKQFQLFWKFYFAVKQISTLLKPFTCVVCTNPEQSRRFNAAFTHASERNNGKNRFRFPAKSAFWYLPPSVWKKNILKCKSLGLETNPSHHHHFVCCLSFLAVQLFILRPAYCLCDSFCVKQNSI